MACRWSDGDLGNPSLATILVASDQIRDRGERTSPGVRILGDVRGHIPDRPGTLAADHGAGGGGFSALKCWRRRTPVSEAE